MDENSVSLQMFLILLSFITLGPESKISLFKQCQSNTQMSGSFWARGVCAESFIMHFARFNFSRLSLAFILKYYPILHVVKR